MVGAGLGGLRAAEALRAHGYRGEVVVVGEERHLPYSRPPLSKEVLAAAAPDGPGAGPGAGPVAAAHAAVAFPLRGAVADVRWMPGVRAVGVDAAARRVLLAAAPGAGAGRPDPAGYLGFDGLVAATGLVPRRLDVPGPAPGPGSGRHVLRTLEDALALRAALRPGARVVVVGAGFVGCEVAAAARGLGCAVTVAAPEELPLVAALGVDVAAELRRRHEAAGVAFRLGTTVASLDAGPGRSPRGGRVAAAVLADGGALPCDVLVEALGAQPDTDWLRGTGADLSDGVRTDAGLRALRPGGAAVDGVAAVGDVARFPNPRFDDVPRRVEHWSTPTDTGRRAGAVLAAWLADRGAAAAPAAGPGPALEAALAAPFAPLPSFWSDQLDLRLQAFGLPHLADRVRVLEGDLRGAAVVGYERGGDLVAVVGLDATPALLPYRRRIGRSAA